MVGMDGLIVSHLGKNKVEALPKLGDELVPYRLILHVPVQKNILFEKASNFRTPPLKYREHLQVGS